MNKTTNKYSMGYNEKFVDMLINRDYSKRLLSEGKIALTTLQQYQKFWLDFVADPDAFSYMPFGEVVGFK